MIRTEAPGRAAGGPRPGPPAGIKELALRLGSGGSIGPLPARAGGSCGNCHRSESESLFAVRFFKSVAFLPVTRDSEAQAVTRPVQAYVKPLPGMSELEFAITAAAAAAALDRRPQRLAARGVAHGGGTVVT